MMMSFEKELEALLNRFSQENGSDTPDFILAKYLNDCLTVWNHAIAAREQWYGRVKARSNNASLCIPAPTRRPTIAELEDILSQQKQPNIEYLPNGEVVIRADEADSDEAQP